MLFVIDNSGTMGEEQLNLARNFPMMIEELQSIVDGSSADVNIMVTTTDFGNPACDEFRKPDYVPAKGSPVSTPCTDRIERFEGNGMNPPVLEEACYDVCPMANPAFPRDHFIHFDPDGTNVEGGTPSAALACIGPQGIDGCGYEAPLETMLQALNRGACWNDPDAENCEDSGYTTGFLREEAILAIAIITDEADCSVRNYSIMQDPIFMETDPQQGTREPSSAICWNAGVLCTGLDADTGVYEGCAPADKSIDGDVGVPDTAVLHPLYRYTQLLDEFRGMGREVIMLGVLGVPPVTKRNENPPYQPTEGGVDDLEFRDWRDEDVLPDEAMDGTTAEYKQFEFGIGPGCTEVSESHAGQAIPPVRIRHVCESLNTPRRPRDARGRVGSTVLHRVNLRYRFFTRTTVSDRLDRKCDRSGGLNHYRGSGSQWDCGAEADCILSFGEGAAGIGAGGGFVRVRSDDRGPCAPQRRLHDAAVGQEGAGPAGRRAL